MDLRQFKLADGDEILCEVLEWHEEEDALVIRKTLKLVMMDNMANGVRYYAFRPFMMYQMNPKAFQIINCQHIIAEASPTQDLINEYFNSLESLAAEESSEKELNTDEIRKRAAEKAKAYIKTYVESAGDSDTMNIINFPTPSDKIH